MKNKQLHLKEVVLSAVRRGARVLGEVFFSCSSAQWLQGMLRPAEVTSCVDQRSGGTSSPRFLWRGCDLLSPEGWTLTRWQLPMGKLGSVCRSAEFGSKCDSNLSGGFWGITSLPAGAGGHHRGQGNPEDHGLSSGWHQQKPAAFLASIS